MASIRVNTKEPFELVLSLYQHPQLGYLLDFIAVQLMPNGQYSLLAQKMHQNTAADFGAGKETSDLIRLLDETEPEALIKKFYPSKKPIRVADFFAKHYSPELHARIRPYIEKRMLKALENAGTYKLFLARDKNFTHTRIQIAEEKASILFHFRRNETGTHYFATIRLGENKISFSQNDSELIIQEPAWLLCNKKLITFKKDTDGNKLKPFLQKKFISIPRQSEAVYFEKFVRGLIENYDVYAEGFEIRSERYRAFPTLKLTRFGDKGLCAGLYFNYGPYQFPYHSLKMVSVSLEKKGEEYIFHRIKRSKSWEQQMADRLHEAGMSLMEGSLFEADGKQGNLVQLLNLHMPALEKQGFVIDQSQLNRSYFLGDSRVSIQISKNRDWFDLQAVVFFGRFQIPFLRLKQYILNGNREFELPDGSIALIPEEWFTRYSGLFEFAESGGEDLRIRKYHFGLLSDIAREGTGAGHYKIDEFDPEHAYELPPKLKAVLRPYQLTGYRWLRYMEEQGFGACLADDMGLGKTVQVLAYLQYRAAAGRDIRSEAKSETIPAVPDSQGAAQLQLFETQTDSPARPQNSCHCSLVIVPTSLIYNWQSEMKQFTGLKHYIHSGFNRKRSLQDICERYDVIVSSYGTVRNDIEMFSGIEFDTIVLDESQSIKNPSSQTAVSVNQLRARRKIAMTGTPVENSITDLWSQINFLNPGILGNYHFFARKFVASVEKEKNEEETRNLRNIVKPFILRRTKEQVASDLPGKTEKIVYCEMSEEQKQTYESIKSQFRNELLHAISENGFKKSNIMILNGLIKLRQIANHPVLADEQYLAGSGKFDQITASLHNVVDAGHKVLVFSQFVQHLQLLKNYLDSKQMEYYYIAGNIPAMERKALVDRFQKEKSAAIFLISLKAGGTGLNLTAADYVFLLDPWWNPAVERQAMDRSHRIGQNKPVFVYKFITKDSIEEKIVHLQSRKQKVSDDILDTEAQFVNNLEEDALKNLLD